MEKKYIWDRGRGRHNGEFVMAGKVWMVEKKRFVAAMSD